jgi:hypothetical protein
MNVEIGTETPIFLFWEYLFQILGILSLQLTTQKKILSRGKNMILFSLLPYFSLQYTFYESRAIIAWPKRGKI